MSKIIHTLRRSLLPRVMRIAALTLAFSANGLANNLCETSTSLINPLATTHSNIKENNSTVIIQSGIGGTGIHDSGIGGTGIKEDGIGGTGGHASNNDGIGGTGGRAFNDDGMGGTGGQAYNDDGMGGTGGQAFNNDGMGGTGIIGIITGFASICVNGVKIHYEADTPVTIDGRSSTTHDLAVGQMVAIRANGIGNEVTARNIAVIHAVVGPVDSFNPETGKMQVLDQTIQVHDQGRLEYLQTSDWVQVSGHRLSDGTIVASRIELSHPLEQAWINGHVTQADTTGFIVNGTRIEIDQHVRPEGIIPGAEISASGQWNNESLQVQHVQVDPTDQLMDQVERVVIEGYVQPISNEEFNIGNQTFILEPDLQAAVNSNDDIGQDQLIQATGTMSASADSIVVDHVEFSAAVATFIPDLETGDVLYGGGDNEGDKDGPAELEKNSNEEIETDENHDNSLDESNQDNLEAESENHPDSDHSLESIEHEPEQESNDASHLDSPNHGHLEQPEDLHSHDDFIPSTHDSMEISDGPEAFDTFDGTNDHLDMPIDLDAFDGPNDHDMFDDLHHDWDFDQH